MVKDETLPYRLSAFWRNKSVEFVRGASEDDLSRFERQHGLLLAVDMIEYFRSMNGTADADDEGFRFWPITELAPLEKQNAQPPEIGHSKMFVFADYLIMSRMYAISLNSITRVPERAVVVCGASPRRIASSFTEFMELYMSNGSELYSG